MTRLLPLVILGSLVLTGCSISQDSREIALAIPADWSVTNLPQADVETDRWWTAIGDPRLDSIAEQAGDVSDVALAEARLWEARARLGKARSALRPEIALTGRAERLDVGEIEQDTFQSLLNFSLNPDLNGALRARAEGERLRLESQAARVEAVRIRVRSTAVQLYSAVHEAETRAMAANRAVEALEATLQVTMARQRAGLATELDAASDRTALSAARVRPVAARQAAAEARLGLEALLGLEPGGVRALTDFEGRPGITVPEIRALAAPTAVLARRPELRAAELELWAAGADAEAARRDFWPTLSLASALGGQSLNPETPFTASGFLDQITVGLTAPVFSFGRLGLARDAADARSLQAEIAYRQAAIDALVGVEGALIALASAEARTVMLAQALNAAEDQIGLASSRYRAGLSSIDAVLIAQKDAAGVEEALAVARGDALVSFARFNAEVGLGGRAGHRDLVVGSGHSNP